MRSNAGTDTERTTRSKTRKMMQLNTDPIGLLYKIKNEINVTYRRLNLQTKLLDLVDRDRDEVGDDRYYRHYRRKLFKLKKPDENLYDYLYDLYCYLLTATTTTTTIRTDTQNSAIIVKPKKSSTYKVDKISKPEDQPKSTTTNKKSTKLSNIDSNNGNSKKLEPKVTKKSKTKTKKKKKSTTSVTRRYNKSQNYTKKERRLDEALLFSCTLDSCTFSTKSLASFKVHQQKKHGIQDRFECKICLKSFKHTKSLDHHLKLVHDSVNVYPCNIDNCEESFASWELVRKHKIEIHEGRNTYECELCQRVYKTKSSLISHQKVHDDLVCDIDGCGKSFSTKMSFRRHQRLEHQPPEYHCAKCSKTFYEKAQFSKHQKLVDCTWMYRCHIANCAEEYRKLKQLAEHTQTVHQCEPRFVCSWTDCPYSSHSLYLLNNHYRKHTGERPYPCSWPGCDWRFKTMWLLLTHRKIHLNKRNYHCTWPGCSHRSNTSQNFRRHILIHEKNEKLRVANLQQQPPQPQLTNLTMATPIGSNKRRKEPESELTATNNPETEMATGVNSANIENNHPNNEIGSIGSNEQQSMVSIAD